MRLLVCVKRVPAPGARIPLTEDARSIDAANLGHTVSPHEECALEEAVQIAERTGGEVTVLTLGDDSSIEQLRTAISVGADRAVLAKRVGEDWDPQATATGLTDTIRRLEETDGPYDLILFGNESADAGNYQVGIRVARALGRPVVNGIKGIDLDHGVARAKRQTASGFEVFSVPIPAVIGVKEGINLPRYPTLPGRMKARKAEIDELAVERVAGDLALKRLVHPPQVESPTEILGTGADAASRVVDLLQELGLVTA